MSTGPAPPRPHRATRTANLQSSTEMEVERQGREVLNALIRSQMVSSLGTPPDLIKMQVHPVGGHRYRVNVFAGKDAMSGRIANSFFLTTDAEGKILESSPEIVRLYGLKT
jgi:hypothetical protein